MGSRFYALSSLPIILINFSILENITDMDENTGEESEGKYKLRKIN